MDPVTVTILGSGTSTGVPMIGCDCRTCLSNDPRDKRLRVSVLLDTADSRILIDTSADFRQQMLLHRVKRLDGILYTHHHYDHIAGFDDLRAFQFLLKRAPGCFALQETYDHIRRTFAYAFGAAVQSGGGLPDVPFTVIDREPFTINGTTITPIPVRHGVLEIRGYRIGNFAYLTDCSAVPEDSVELLRGLDVLVLDGLRYKAHPTHMTIEESVEMAWKIGARMTYLTHMNHDILHEEASRALPANVQLAYDGLEIYTG